MKDCRKNELKEERKGMSKYGESGSEKRRWEEEETGIMERKTDESTD